MSERGEDELATAGLEALRAKQAAHEEAEGRGQARELAAATAALRVSEAKYRTLFDSMDEGFLLADLLFDAEGRPADIFYLEANPAATRMLGQDFTGRRLKEVDPAYEHYWYETFGGVARTGEAVRMELYAEPLKTWFDFNVFKVGEADGRRVAVIFKAVTDRKRAESALRDADTRKDEFLAMLGHELRNPLAPLQGIIETLQRQRLDDGALEQAYAMMARQVEHLTRLVDDLLDVSRITRGLVNLRKGPVDLVRVAELAVEMAAPAVDGRGHDLTMALPTKPVWIEGDETRLTQVVFNLVNNAAKYTDPGGRIWLTVEREGDRTLVRVRDNGVGMSAELVPKVFDVFTQGERSPDRSQGGRGRGRTQGERRLEMHGGTVEAFSSGAGKGSEVVVRLPASPAQAEKPRPLQPPRQPRAVVPRERALVVDDNVDVAQSLTWILEELAREIRTVHSGTAALETAREWRPDIILCDLGMPQMDGYEVCRRLRQVPELEGVLIVAVSGYGGEGERRKSKEAGFDRHLVKPIDWATLEEIFKGAAGRTPSS